LQSIDTGCGCEESDHKKKAIKMKISIRSLCLAISLCLPLAVSAGHHEVALKLEKRQADAVLQVTSVILGDDATTITATGDMGAYGKVYTTYTLRMTDLTSGTVSGQGRGVINNDIAFGTFAGYYFREGAIITMHNVVQLNDGSQNLDVIILDTAKSQITVEAYVLK
jgi:hypothetical protein